MGYRWIGILGMVVMLAGCSSRPVWEDGASLRRRELAAVDSLMWQRPDSAFAMLLEFAASSGADSLDEFNRHYCQMLVSELLYKNDYQQSNRPELLEAVVYFDSIGDAFLDARAHYIKGVGYYERDSVVEACTEYLKALEVMEGRFEEEALAGHKTMFMFFTYNRLMELFSAQFMMDPAINCGKWALACCYREPSLFHEIPNTLFYIGKQYDKKGEKDTASYYYGQAIKGLAETNGPIYRDAFAMKALCDYQMGSGAEESLKTIKQTLVEVEEKKERMRRYLAIGAIFMSEGAYDSAMYYFETIYKNEPNDIIKIRIAESLRVVYDSIGDQELLEDCIRYLAEHKRPEGESKAMVSKLEDLFKGYLDQKQAKQAEADRKRSIRKTIAIIVPIVVFVAVAITLIAKIRRKKMREEHEVLRLELLQREEQISALQKTLAQQREKGDHRREAFLNEAICQHILGLLHGKHFSSRDTYGQHNISLGEKDFILLKEAVERHYKGFDSTLLRRCPSLKSRDLTLSHLYLLGLSEVEIAALNNRTYSAILKRQGKLQKQLGVEKSVSDYVLGVLEELYGINNVPQGVPQDDSQESLQIIVKLVSNNPKITREEIANQLGVSTKTIGRYLKKLSGRVRYVGSGYSGHWEIED